VDATQDVMAATPGSNPIVRAARKGQQFEQDEVLGGINGKSKGTFGGLTVTACPVESVDGGRGAGCELAAGFANEALGNLVDMPGSAILDNEDGEPMLVAEWLESIDWEAESKGVERVLSKWWVGFVDDATREAMAQIGMNVTDLEPRYLDQILGIVGSRVTRITETSKEQVRRLVLEAIERIHAELGTSTVLITPCLKYGRSRRSQATTASES
jgi:hypothetical protein